jgi:membrane protease YdiL (CAAX protease family)
VLFSVLFSAAHYIMQPFPDAAFIALFFFGLAQCWLYKKTERLWCPILNHCLFNLTNVVLVLLIPQ